MSSLYPLDLANMPLSGHQPLLTPSGTPSSGYDPHAATTMPESSYLAWRPQSSHHHPATSSSGYASSFGSEPDDIIAPNQMTDRQLIESLLRKVSSIFPLIVLIKRKTTRIEEALGDQVECLRVLRVLHSFGQSDSSNDRPRPNSHDLDELFEVKPAMKLQADMLRVTMVTLHQNLLAQLKCDSAKVDGTITSHVANVTEKLDHMQEGQFENQANTMKILEDFFKSVKKEFGRTKLLEIYGELADGILELRDDLRQMVEDMNENQTRRHSATMKKLHLVQTQQTEQHKSLIERLDRVDMTLAHIGCFCYQDNLMQRMNQMYQTVEEQFEKLRQSRIIEKVDHIEFVQMQQENTIMQKLEAIRLEQVNQLNQLNHGHQGRFGLPMSQIMQQFIVEMLVALESKIDGMTSLSVGISQKPKIQVSSTSCTAAETAELYGDDQQRSLTSSNSSLPPNGQPPRNPGGGNDLLEALWNLLWPVLVMVLLVLLVAACEGYGYH